MPAHILLRCLCSIDLNGWFWKTNSLVLTIPQPFLSLLVQPVQCCRESNCTVHNLCTAVQPLLHRHITAANHCRYDVVTWGLQLHEPPRIHTALVSDHCSDFLCDWSQGCRMGAEPLYCCSCMHTLMLNQVSRKLQQVLVSHFSLLPLFWKNGFSNTVRRILAEGWST